MSVSVCLSPRWFCSVQSALSLLHGDSWNEVNLPFRYPKLHKTLHCSKEPKAKANVCKKKKKVK